MAGGAELNRRRALFVKWIYCMLRNRESGFSPKKIFRAEENKISDSIKYGGFSDCRVD